MQITDRFGPIPTSVVLDASGNGTVSFQPNGKNARITTLFVKVATSIKQATCTLYKGQVSDSNVINNTNSGSTGAPAWGQIDLLDGETLYVVWRGGDVGATATATFVGIALPFDQIGAPYVQWSDPIAAGDGSLIFPAIKSPNYVAGSVGWMISRNGDAEFNNIIVRGKLIVNGINGAYMSADSLNGVPTLVLNPGVTDPYNYDPGSIYAQAFEFPGIHHASTVINSPSPTTAVGLTSIEIQSESHEGDASGRVLIVGPDSANGLEIFNVSIFGRLKVDGSDIGGGWVAGGGLTAVQTAVNGTETIQITAKDSGGNTPTWKAGRIYRIETSVPVLAANVATQPQFRIRKTNTVGQQLDAFNGSCVTTTALGNPKYTSYFQIGANNIAADIVLTIMGSAANSVQVRAFPTSPAEFNIYDDGIVGSPAQRTWVPTLI